MTRFSKFFNKDLSKGHLSSYKREEHSNKYYEMLCKDNVNIISSLGREGYCYMIFYVNTGVVVGVQRNTFRKVDGKVVVIGDYKIKMHGASFKSEAWTQLMDFVGGLNVIVNFIQSLGHTVKAILKKKVVYLAHLSRILIDVRRLLSGPITFEEVISVVLSLFLLKEQFMSESMDALLLTGLSFVAPAALMDIIKRMQSFSSVKIAEDFNLFHKVVVLILDFIGQICKLIPFPQVVQDKVLEFLDAMGLLSHHVLITEIESVLDFVKKNPHALVSDDYRSVIKTMKDKIDSNKALAEWSRRSESVKVLLQSFNRVYLLSNQYEHVSRQEPACYIFDGPPGCLKSVLMSEVIKVLGQSAYSHHVEPASSGKEFFDNYNNQEIIYMDDVGQMDISQWRTIINMVSGIILPLPCAQAHLKDTKFFNSNKIFVTTNCFKDIQLRTDCGIANKEALHRRGYVFNMSQVRRSKVTQVMQGSVKFEFYNIDHARFENGFPIEMCKYFAKWMPTLEPTFNFSDIKTVNSGGFEEYIAWICKIVTISAKVKSVFYAENLARSKDRAMLKCELSLLEEVMTSESGDFSDDKFFCKMANITTPKQRLCLSNKVENFPTSIWVGRFFNRTVTIPSYYSEKFVELLSNSANYMRDVNGMFFRVTDMVVPPVNFGDLWVSFRNFITGNDGVLPENKSTYWMEYVSNLVKDWIESFLSLIVDNWDAIFHWIIFFGIVFSAVALVFYFQSSSFKSESDFVEKFKDSNINELTTSVRAVSRNAYYVKMHSKNKENSCYCTMSGRRILVPYHILEDNPTHISVLKSLSDNYVVVDHEKFEVVYVNKDEDVAVISLPSSYSSPWKNISSCLSTKNGQGSELLVNADGFVYVDGIRKTSKVPRLYKHSESLSVVVRNGIVYDLRGKQMCGTLLLDKDGSLKGMHVAGDAATNTGLAVIWSDGILERVLKAMDDRKPTLPFDIQDKVIPNFSGMKLDADFGVYSPNNSNLIKSTIYGVFPVVRTPANLTIYGPHTKKDVAKKSFQLVSDTNQEELDFADKVINSMIPEFHDISMDKVIRGYDNLAGLNKDSSNGYRCKKAKSDYVDFDKGELLEFAQYEFDDWFDAIKNQRVDVNGNIPIDVINKFVWCEALKDELRSVTKNGVPRSFRVGTIYSQIATKMLCGDLVSKLMKTRDFHGIMIGLNPYKEWDAIAQDLSRCDRIWAGDIASWDGKMLTQVMRNIVEILVQKYKGSHKEVLVSLLENTIHSIVAINDDVYVTTHSMPSGSYLTAMLNSIVNKYYTAMWYKRNASKPTVESFWKNVVDYVYGDDKVNGIKQGDDELNAITMRDFFRSIGMDFTDSIKKVIIAPSQEISEITFLKRSFVFHRVLGKIMCPLDMDTLYSSLSWCDKTKDSEIVLHDKIHNFQREIYLHHNWRELLEDFSEKLKSVGVDFKLLPEAYMKYLYEEEVEDFVYF